MATTGVPWKPYEGLHIMFYTRRSTHKRTLRILRWTSAVCLALYTDASRAAYVLEPLPSRGGDLELEGGVNVSLILKIGRGLYLCLNLMFILILFA